MMPKASEVSIVYISLTSAGLISEAKRWLECATQICRFVPYGETQAEKVGERNLTLRVHQ